MQTPPEILEQLSRAGVDNPTRDSNVLMRWAMRTGGVDPQTMQPSERAMALYIQAVMDRVQRRPVSKIIGERAFWDLEFEVTEDVLDPRPDTETLVETALEKPFKMLLDLGTGSGCIAISLLHARPQAAGIATDCCTTALRVARRNAERANLKNIAFRQSDWFSDITEQFDLILSNPPYIRADEMEGLAPEVRDFDPRIALTDEGDGLSAYRAIAASALDHMTAGGRLMVEIGLGQAPDVIALFEAAGLVSVETRDDLTGRTRVVIGQAPPQLPLSNG